MTNYSPTVLLTARVQQVQGDNRRNPSASRGAAIAGVIAAAKRARALRIFGIHL